MTVSPAVRLKYLVEINCDSLPEDTPADAEFRYIDISTCGRGRLEAEPEMMRFADAPSRARRRVRQGDTIISTVRTYLRAAWPVVGPTDDLVVSTGFVVLSPRPGLDARFLGWVAQSDLLIEEIVARSVGVSYPAINGLQVGDLAVPVPDLVEQRAIADYLEAETARIDSLMGAKQEVLDLLAERRDAVVAALIAKMPEASPRSNLPWLRAVPAHWPSVSLGKFADVFNGSTPHREESVPGDIPWTTSGDIDQGVITQPTAYISEDVQHASGLRIAPSGSIVVGLVGQGRTRGLAAQLAISTTLNQNLAAICPRDDRLDPTFVGLLLALAYDDLRNGGRGGNQAALNCEMVKAYRIPLPPREEQHQLVERVMAERARDEAMASLLTRSVDLLRERRQALITAAVAGQLEIPGVPA